MGSLLKLIRRYSFLWRHLEMNSDLLLSKKVGLVGLANVKLFC